MPLLTVFSEQSERYLTFFAYLYTRKLKAPVVREVRLAYICLECLLCRFDLLQTSQPWIESDRKTESSGQKARVNTTFDMIVLITSLFSYNARVLLSYIKCGFRIAFVLTRRGNAKTWRSGMK